MDGMTRERLVALLDRYLLRHFVWSKGQTVPGFDHSSWRKDVCGALMRWDNYGDRNSPYGWEIDHINPHGGDSPGNLQPLQWQNNIAKSDGVIRREVTAIGWVNVRCSSTYPPNPFSSR